MRRETDHTATFGRDKDKRFKIVEMSAFDAFDWATKAMLSMAKSGVDIPSDIASQGMAGVAIVALRTVGGLEFMSVRSLRDDLLRCVTIYTDFHKNPMHTRPITGQDDIEEPQTIYELCKAVLEHHLGFSIAEGLSRLAPRTPSAGA
jgi:hypothetical protein